MSFRSRRVPGGLPTIHPVLGSQLRGPWPEGTSVIYVGLGCFWGAEKTFWQLPGVVSTAVGYQGGVTADPTYEQVCTGLTGHAETVMVVYDPGLLPERELFRVFWESHDPTQGQRQGNDVGSQYRSVVHWTTREQQLAYEETRGAYQDALRAGGLGPITTEGRPAADAGPFHYAEDYHQQYLYKVPQGYCPGHGTGISCPIARAAGA